MAHEQAAIVARALMESEPSERAKGPIGRHTPGDARRLRGIPVVGVQGGVGGAIGGSKPGQSRKLDRWSGRKGEAFPGTGKNVIEVYPEDPPFFAKVLDEEGKKRISPRRGKPMGQNIEIIQRDHRRVTPSLRSKVIARDKQTCYLCGKRCRLVEIHIDHIVPVALGGRTEMANLGVACADCNTGKGDRETLQRPSALLESEVRSGHDDQ